MLIYNKLVTTNSNFNLVTEDNIMGTTDKEVWTLRQIFFLDSDISYVSFCGSTSRFRQKTSFLLAKVQFFTLFNKDKRQDGVWTEAEVVGEETLPKGEKSFVFDDSSENIDNALVLGDAVDKLERNYKECNKTFAW